MRVTVHTDGAARGNPGPAGAGAVVYDERGRVLAEVARGLGEATNNVAEYTAVILGLERARALGAREVVVRTDSQLLVQQLRGRYRVRSARLRPLHARVEELARAFDEVRFEHVPRDRNVTADRLANRGVDAWLERRSGAGAG
ncbi:MAG: hypothetical protein KatS3mg013_0668 [Actinomycetota bacterium]|nr:MAG: hypothetical protein KatS3mg013_0668 [Actinomycetota bacterium]